MQIGHKSSEIFNINKGPSNRSCQFTAESKALYTSDRGRKYSCGNCSLIGTLPRECVKLQKRASEI